MPFRQSITVGSSYFVVSLGCTSPSALGLPLSLKLAANENLRVAGKARWWVVQGGMPLAAVNA